LEGPFVTNSEIIAKLHPDLASDMETTIKLEALMNAARAAEMATVAETIKSQWRQMTWAATRAFTDYKNYYSVYKGRPEEREPWPGTVWFEPVIMTILNKIGLDQHVSRGGVTILALEFQDKYIADPPRQPRHFG
jgi:hypothetical protein